MIHICMINIYVQHITPRLQYTLKVLFETLLQLPYRIISNKQDMQTDAVCIYYSNNKVKNELCIPKSGFLSENNIREFTPDIVWDKDIPMLFYAKKGTQNTFSFDLFSACFYMLSRYEEYTYRESDEHGRFRGINSFAYQNNFLHIPIVNLYAGLLRNAISEKAPAIRSCTPGEYKFEPTIDIDIPYAIQHKPLWRYSSSLIKNMAKGNFTQCSSLLKSGSKNFKDPYNTYDSIGKMDAQYETTTRYFLSVGNYGTYDKSLSYKNKAYIQLIQKLLEKHPVGLHTSYRAAFQEKLIKKERRRLEEICHTSITSNRNHYLRINLQESYRFMEEAGIQKDYSMCFHDAPGFRAGICHPFPFYDLRQEKTLHITIFPTCMMDNTFTNHLQIQNIEEAYRIAKNIIDQVKKYRGIFIPIFHNSTISPTNKKDYTGKLYEKTMRYASQKSIN
jgi:hypothetical protein